MKIVLIRRVRKACPNSNPTGTRISFFQTTTLVIYASTEPSLCGMREACEPIIKEVRNGIYRCVLLSAYLLRIFAIFHSFYITDGSVSRFIIVKSMGMAGLRFQIILNDAISM